MIDTEWIEDFIKKQEKIRDRNFRNYQDSGESRYYRAHRRAEDLIELADMALGISDTKSKNHAYCSAIAECGNKAISILHYGIDNDPEAVRELIGTMKTYALMFGLVADKWK